MKRIIVLLMMLILSIVLVGCNNESEKKEKEIVKNELTQYVNNLSKAEIIKIDMKYVTNIIDSVDKMKNVKNEKKKIINEVKTQIDKVILTKEIEDIIKEDFNNYEYKEKYGYEINPKVRCYGIYNKAVVMFILLPSDVVTNIDVEGINFYYPSEFTILVWYEHLFYSFDNLYDVENIIKNGILNIEDIKLIRDIHEQWEK